MTAAGASKHALALAVRGCRRELSAVAPGRETAALSRDLLRAVVERHVRSQALSLDEAELPWLFGPHAAPEPLHLSVRAVLDRVLGQPHLDSVWSDASVLGWVYQFWSDERREAIDARIGARGRVSPVEVATKTQLFTERYMVDWLLENSLGAIARGMTIRRRGRLGRGPDLGPGTPLEGSGYYVAAAGVEDEDEVPARLRDLKLLDPACGSGHFLVGAFDLLVPLYRAEAADEGRTVTGAAIAHEILAFNLHGIDIDSEAVRVAATVLLLKAKQLAAPEPFRAPPLSLLGLTFDPAAFSPELPLFQELARQVPGGAASITQAAALLEDWSFRGTLTRPPIKLGLEERSALRAVLATRTEGDELGIRGTGPLPPLDVRLGALLEAGRYDVVAANPPYLSTAKISLPKARLREIFGELPDLFAAFVDRTLGLCKPRGRLAFVAPSNWLFLPTFAAIRARVLAGELVLLADLGKGAFRHASKLIQTSMVVTSPRRPVGRPPRLALGARVGNQASSDEHQTSRLAAALLDASVFHPFEPAACEAIAGAPLLFWLDRAFLAAYRGAPKIGQIATGASGTATGDNERFLRAVWEIPPSVARAAAEGQSDAYVPYVKGADGEAFFEPYRWVLRSADEGRAARLNGASFELPVSRKLGIAYTTIGHRFAARLHTVPSVRDVSGASFFPVEGISASELLCALNRTPVRALAHALNPSINFQQGDVRRLPFARHPRAEAIVRTLQASFEQEQRTRETSPSFSGPGPSSWQETQRWAQRAIDDPSLCERAPSVADLTPRADAIAHLSAALGLALGRFVATQSGLRLADPDEAAGRPFLLIDALGDDDLDHDAAAPLRAAWSAYGAALAPALSSHTLEHYLRTHAFGHHLVRHAGRPAYLPITSPRRTVVVFVWVQRLDQSTLGELLRTCVEPRLRASRQAQGSATGPGKLRTDELATWAEELQELLQNGPRSPAHPKERDAPFVPFVEDGPRILAASLWSLVWPLWKEPRADWLTLAAPTGKRHFDWSRTAARHFPTRVDALCRRDPSVADAHGRLEELHPAVARRWETKLTNATRSAGSAR